MKPSCYIYAYCIRDHQNRRVAYFYDQDPQTRERIASSFNGCDFTDDSSFCWKCRDLFENALSGNPLPDTSEKFPFIPPEQG